MNIILIFLLVFKLSAADLKEGIKLFNKASYKEAKIVFLEIIKNDMKNYTSYFYLGKTSRILGDNDNAVLALQKAMELQPDKVEPYIELADVYLATGNQNLAEKYCSYVLEYDKENDRLFYILGQIYFNKEDYAKAKLSFQKACKYNSANAYYYNVIGLTYMKLNQDNKANTAFLTAVAFDSKIYFFYFNLGLSYENLEKWEKAKDSYEKCLKLNKNYRYAGKQLKKVKNILRRKK